jgi:hypothetical protein
MKNLEMDIERTPLLGGGDSVSGKELPHPEPQPNQTYSSGIVDGGANGALSSFKTGTSEDDYVAWPSFIPAPRQKRVIIVGAGVSGVQ